MRSRPFPTGASWRSSTSGSSTVFLNSVNHAAKHFGVTGYNSIFDFWRGDITLVAEPPGFSVDKLPPDHFFTVPSFHKTSFRNPKEIGKIPRNKRLIYFAMGSSGTREIVAKIIESFQGKPYRVKVSG